MSRAARRGVLLGRRHEQQVLAEVVDRARAGRSGALVVRGEAGIGKTTLLADAVAGADDLRVVQISGAESELELTYAGMQQLCTPLLTGLERLPAPQRDALQVALGLCGGAAPDRLLVGVALLSLLGEAGADQPTVCIVDDAQWVDHASMQALTFAARRLAADAVVMIFAARATGADPQLAGLPELPLGRLADEDARALLAAVMPGRIDETVRENILTEADGNPLALLELKGALPPARLAGGYGLAAAGPLATRIEQTYGRRLHELPSQTRTLLLLAACEPTGEPAWLWAAAEHIGVPADAVTAAEDNGLVTLDSRLSFRHPLVRSAVYRSVSPSERRQAHATLARVISGPSADEHRAWHRAHATNTPDETVAAELVDAAERARRRGGAAAAAAFLTSAVKLTPEPVARAERALDAARAKLDAADPGAAGRLLAAVAPAGRPLLDARADLLRAKIAFAVRRGRDAPPLLLTAAERLRPFDPVLSRETYLEALMAAMIVGRCAAGEHVSATAIAAAAQHAPPPSDPPSAVDLFLDGLVVRLTQGHTAAAPRLQRAVDKYLRDAEAGTADPRWHDVTNRVLLDLFEQDTYDALNARQTAMLRAAGELTVLPAALTTHAGACVTSGDFTQAEELLDQSDAISLATGAPPHRSIRAYLAACRGREREAKDHAEATIREATSRGEGSEITIVLFALAVLHNGHANYAEALTQCTAALSYPDVGMYGHLLNELVEAAARAGETGTAEDAAGQLIQRAEVLGTATAQGYAARAKALVASGDSVENDFVTAIMELEQTPLRVLTARTHLTFGEWLRRANRRADAGTQLRRAYEMFMKMGADGFAERARRELHAAGQPQRRERDGLPAVELTTQESYIARLAGDGYTNSEIAGHLFLSPRTVEWHLGKIFVKLGVSSRRELRGLSEA